MLCYIEREIILGSVKLDRDDMFIINIKKKRPYFCNRKFFKYQVLRLRVGEIKKK
jgi:hypothetical protein